jgi:predicted nucleic acid-binding Zn ribbon protein
MATAVEQTNCDRCQAPLVKGAAYCEKCGERTHRARRLVRLAVRVEVLLILIVILLIFGFTWVFLQQKP